MKMRSLPFLVIMLLLFGFNTNAQTISISSGSGDTVCSGTSVTFTATAAGSTTYGYVWHVNGAIVGTSTATYTTTTLTNGSTVYCFLTNAAGDTTEALSDTLTMTVDSLPVISAITGPDSVCVGASIQLTDATSGGVWSSTNTTQATVGSAGLVTGVGAAAGGGGGGPMLRIVYKMTNGCGSDSVRFRVRINTPASAITTPGTICIDSNAFIMDSSRGGVWVSSDSTIAGFVSQFGIMQGYMAGTVTITYTLANACGSFTETAGLTVVNCDSAESVKQVVSLANSCNIYPNPSTGAFAITVRSAKYSEANCTVANMVGEKVKDMTISTNKETQVQMNVPTGMYFITVSAGSEKYTSKMMIVQ